MVSVLRIGLLWLAGVLLLAHSVVPHGHAKPNGTREHETLWSLSNPNHSGHPLEADLGADHLENFRVDDQTIASSVATDGETDFVVGYTSEAYVFKKMRMCTACTLPKGKPFRNPVSHLFFLTASGNRPPPPTV
jgi:hypothetical protein